MSCPECHGFGMVIKCGDYKSHSGALHFNAIKATRCSLYMAYFAEMAERGIDPKTAPIGLTMCDAAVNRHDLIRRWTSEEKPKRWYTRKRL